MKVSTLPLNCLQSDRLHHCLIWREKGPSKLCTISVGGERKREKGQRGEDIPGEKGKSFRGAGIQEYERCIKEAF